MCRPHIRCGGCRPGTTCLQHSALGSCQVEYGRSSLQAWLTNVAGFHVASPFAARCTAAGSEGDLAGGPGTEPQRQPRQHPADAGRHQRRAQWQHSSSSRSSRSRSRSRSSHGRPDPAVAPGQQHQGCFSRAQRPLCSSSHGRLRLGQRQPTCPCRCQRSSGRGRPQAEHGPPELGQPLRLVSATCTNGSTCRAAAAVPAAGCGILAG